MSITTTRLNQLLYFLYLAHVFSSASKIAQKFSENFPDLLAAKQADNETLTTLGLTSAQVNKLKKAEFNCELSAAIDRELEWAQKDDQHILTCVDVNYPALLKEIHGFPLVLFIKGNKDILNIAQLAIVGSRNPTPIGAENAYEFARYLVQSGLVITSGFALGVDAAAHRGAVAGGGKTIAVMGAGLNYIYPKSHCQLVDEVLTHEGALISEFPLQVAPLPENFPQRNRIISGMSLGTLVVEAAVRSGSLITARLAAEQGREVFAIPSSIHNLLAHGCHALLRQGAKLVENAQDIIEELVPLQKLLPQAEKNSLNLLRPSDGLLLETISQLKDADKKVLTCVGYEVTPLDIVLERSNLTIPEITSILLHLELIGAVQRESGGYIRVK